MSKPHKWAKEIKAWADGAEIEYWNNSAERWMIVLGMPLWNSDAEFRVYQDYNKPQPKEPQYLYVYKAFNSLLQGFSGREYDLEKQGWKYIGKIKLETEDGRD